MSYPLKTFKKRLADERGTVRDTTRTAPTPSGNAPSPNGRPWWIKPPHVRTCSETRSLA